METAEESKEKRERNEVNEWSEWHSRRHSPAGRVLGGIVLIGIGTVLFLGKMDYPIAPWVFTWKMLLVAIGIYVGARHLFRGFGWLIPIIVGLLFLADDFIPGFRIRPFIWPIVIVVMGLFMVFRPKYSFSHHQWRHRRHMWRQHRHHPGSHHPGFHHPTEWCPSDKYQSSSTSAEDRLDTVVVFGSTKKNVISKDFKGGEVTCVFGGAQIDLRQADIKGRAELELNQVFGSTKLIVPFNWTLHMETVAFMGGIEDRRPEGKDRDPEKILILKGSSVFGGLDICESI